MELSVVRFDRSMRTDFVSELKNRVDKHFADKQISKFGNSSMKVKTVFMLALYFVPFTMMLFGVTSSLWVMLSLWVVMSFGMCGIGLSIMHDANHGAYSNKSGVNRVLGYLLNVIGSYHVTWKIQHNVLHHSSTNVHDYDEDLDNQLMRFSPKQDHKSINTYQAYFAPFLYGFLSIYKMLSKDFEQLIRFNKQKLLAAQGVSLSKAIFQISINKVMYFGVTLALPIVVLDFAWWQVLSGFLVMHFICGLMLALIFQCAHVLEKTEFYTADEKGSIDNCWAIHQLNTTANFSRKSRWFSWFIGGLNYQVEHHLFPNICHVHYKDISDIVKSTAAEYDIKYNEYTSFWDAIVSHFKVLNELGKAS